MDRVTAEMGTVTVTISRLNEGGHVKVTVPSEVP
jgi:hypothetical protein